MFLGGDVAMIGPERERVYATNWRCEQSFANVRIHTYSMWANSVSVCVCADGMIR